MECKIKRHIISGYRTHKVVLYEVIDRADREVWWVVEYLSENGNWNEIMFYDFQKATDEFNTRFEKENRNVKS